jgi:beta-adrenergic-receptor kinase
LKEWLHSLRTAHKGSVELLANMARKAGKIYGTDMDANNRQLTQHNSPLASRSTNGT